MGRLAMPDDGVGALRRALEEPAGSHLDDETLAALATAEAAGDEVEALYPGEVAHVEACVRCAEAYGELVELMVEAVDAMAVAAQKASPREVYAALLARRLATSEGPQAAEDVEGVAQRVAAALPVLFTEVPAAPEEVTPALVAAALEAGFVDQGADQAKEEDVAAALAEQVTEAVREQVAALALYLQGAAEAAWKRAPAVRTVIGDRSQEAIVQRGPAPAILREPPAEYGAEGAARRAEEGGGRLPVTLRAVRLSTLACRLEVQVEAVEGAVAGVAVRVQLPGREEVAMTDGRGLATFFPVPIAALPHLVVSVEGE